MLTLFLLITTITADIPGLSEMAAIGLSPLPDTDYCHTSPTNTTCIKQTNTLKTLRNKMSLNASLIREYIHSTSAVGIVIKNSNSFPIYYHWIDNNNNGMFQGRINPHGTTATLSYITHRFFFTKKKHETYKQKIFEIYIDGKQNMFIVPPNNNNDKNDNEFYKLLLKEKKWRDEYEKDTGYPWLSHYDVIKGPRKPTELPMWNADYIGQIYELHSNESYWICDTPTWRRSCRDTKPVVMKMEVVSTNPPIFKIMNTISDFEAEHIIKISKPRLYRSSVGGVGEGMVSTVRTSFNGRLSKEEDRIVNTIYKRANDIFGFKEKFEKFESLQVLHYGIGQEYTPHHDFGENGRKSQRVFTLLFYLNNQLDNESGGETYFPKAMGKGIGMHPGKGNSVMFYSGMKDGNSDDLALHAALPIKKGEKWACNFWIWD